MVSLELLNVLKQQPMTLQVLQVQTSLHIFIITALIINFKYFTYHTMCLQCCDSSEDQFALEMVIIVLVSVRLPPSLSVFK